MAYDFLRTKLQAGALIFKGDLDNEVEALRRAGLVSITDVDYTGTDPAALAARADELRKELATLVEATFFRPSVLPATLAGPAVAAGTAVGDAWARGGHGHAAFVLRELSQRETGTLTYDLTASRVARRTIAPQGALTALAGADVAILDIDAGSPGARSITVVVPAGADWSGVEAVEATFEQRTPRPWERSSSVPAGPRGRLQRRQAPRGTAPAYWRARSRTASARHSRMRRRPSRSSPITSSSIRALSLDGVSSPSHSIGRNPVPALPRGARWSPRDAHGHSHSMPPARSLPSRSGGLNLLTGLVRWSWIAPSLRPIVEQSSRRNGCSSCLFHRAAISS